jgi:hypothetical protein
MLELISVHVSKCAGSSFLRALREAYGAQCVFADYSDRPGDPAAPMNLDPAGFVAADHRLPMGIRAVHGHFHVDKYRSYPDSVPRVAFLRHPVERTLSHYHYWMQLPSVGHRLHDYVLARQLDLVAFARLPFIRRFYSGVMFRDVWMERFHFIGHFEMIRGDVEELGRLLGRTLELGTENAGAPRDELALATRVELEEILREDIDFYRRWAGWRCWRAGASQR